MKVTNAKTRVLQAPSENPLIFDDSGGPAALRDYVALELNTDEGIHGIGLTFFGSQLTPALRQAVDDLCPLVIGQDPMQVEAIAAGLRQAASGAGPGGILTLAMSAIDIAL